jgi:hypothetical protein
MAVSGAGRRMAAEIDGDFVVFLIGLRLNRPWKVWSWLAVFLAMPRMLKELAQHPELGCLGSELGLGTVVQYWRSFEQLEAYARSRDGRHFPGWVEFNRRTAATGDVGIWHETYLVRGGQYEAFYGNMPARGLAKAGRFVPAAGRMATAAARLGASEAAAYPADALGTIEDPGATEG